MVARLGPVPSPRSSSSSRSSIASRLAGPRRFLRRGPVAFPVGSASSRPGRPPSHPRLLHPCQVCGPCRLRVGLARSSASGDRPHTPACPHWTHRHGVEPTTWSRWRHERLRTGSERGRWPLRVSPALGSGLLRRGDPECTRRRQSRASVSRCVCAGSSCPRLPEAVRGSPDSRRSGAISLHGGVPRRPPPFSTTSRCGGSIPPWCT